MTTHKSYLSTHSLYNNLTNLFYILFHDIWYLFSYYMIFSDFHINLIPIFTFKQGFPYLHSVQKYFNALRMDNFNFFSNIAGKFFYEKYNSKTYVVVENQQAPMAMMQNKISSSFLVNYSPILFAYLHNFGAYIDFLEVASS